MYIQVEVETPKSLTRKQRELLKEFETRLEREHEPGLDRLLRPREGILRGPIGSRLSTISAYIRTIGIFRAYRRISRRKSRRVRRRAREGDGRIDGCGSCSSPAARGKAPTTRSLRGSPSTSPPPTASRASSSTSRTIPCRSIRRPRSQARTAAEGRRVQGAARRVSGRVHREPRVQFLDHAAPQEHARLGDTGAGPRARPGSKSTRRACSPSAAPRQAITAPCAACCTLRQILEVGVGATVIPQQLALPRAGDAFEADGSLKDKAQQNC